MEIPPEVLGRILACLEKKDLKEVRLVCKKLERSAVSPLFDEVYLSTNPSEIEIAQNTVRNFGKSIRTVVISAVEYKKRDWASFKIIKRDFHPVKYVRLAYKNYRRLRQEQQEMLQAGTYFGNLCYILRTVSNARRLVITDLEADLRGPEGERRRSRLWRVGDCPILCSIQGCACGNLKHLSYMVSPYSLIDGYEEDTRTWSLVMIGLAATGSHIRELEMDSFWNGHAPRGGFDNTLQQPFALRDIFQHLAKLRLGFFLISEVVERNIAQTLSAATNLKSLYLTAGWDIDDLETCKPGRPTAFQEILGKCRFPQLTSLILSGFHSTSTELVRFLRGSNRLQHLTLAGHHIGRKGRWDSCANSIKVALLSRKHIVIDDVSFGADKFRSDGFEKFHKRRYSHRDLQGFFFQGKTNPFTCAEPQDKRVRVIFLARFDDADHFPGVHARIDVCHASYLEFY